MTKEEIIENNKLIAEFMGYNPHYKNGIFQGYELKPKIITFPEHLKYHTSWDWLMSVVEKIWKITDCRSSIFYFEANEELTIYGKTEPSMDNNKENCYSAVVEFIKWYNENK